MTIRRQKQRPKLTTKFGIGWFGNHTRSSSTNTQRSRRSREFFFGYFLFDGQKNGEALLRAFENKQRKKVTLSAAIPKT